MSFLYRTNKGRVVYNRRPKPFGSHDVLRITSKVLDGMQVGEISSMISGVVILALTTVDDLRSRTEALILLVDIIAQENAWISQVLNEQDINTLQWVADVMSAGAIQITDFIAAYAKWRR